MTPEYRENNFEEQDLVCPHCHWKGKGYDAVVIDFFGVSKTNDVHCPKCDKTIGIIKKDDGSAPGESANDLSFQTG
jgi:hypothetical protein